MKAELLLHRTGAASSASRDRGFPRLWHFATEYLLALPLGAVLALVWANTDPERYFRLVHAAAFLVNDVAMVLFFALITKEIVEATSPGGVLHPWRRAALPVVASLVTAAVPLALFAVLVRVFDEPMLERGWTAVLAVDIALGYFVARMIFGRHPAIAFFLVLAIAANGLGFLALAVVEPIREMRPAIAAGMMAAAVAATFALRRSKVKSFWAYAIVGGGLAWGALFFGGLYPALAPLAVVPFMPRVARDPGFFVDAPTRAADPLNRLELWCRHPAQAALFAFGLINAGVQFRALEAGVWSLPLAAMAGKPLGLLAGVAIGTSLGLHLPRGVSRRDLIPLGFISAIGFTMALFFATATLGSGQILAELKMGAVVSVAAAILAAAAARMLRVGRLRY